jgi:hypothetical protein
MAPATPQGVLVTNPLTDKDLVVIWQVSPTPILGYNVYRSLSRQGPSVKLNTSLVLITFYDDNTAFQQSRTDYWYSITAVDETGESAPSDPVQQNPEANNNSQVNLPQAGDAIEMNQIAILAEGVRRNEILLRRGGETVNVFIRRTAGVRCANFDPVRIQCKLPNCPLCYGVGYQGGYDKYANVLMKIEPFQQQIRLTEFGTQVISGAPSWVTTFPIVKPGDIVGRTINNRRYEIQNLDTKISRAIITRQAFMLNEILRTESPAIFALR